MEDLKIHIKEFIRARDWEQYHAPKNLAMAMSVEAAEILEIFQWKEGEESLTPDELESLRQEIGDVLVYDIIQAAKDKMALNESKYPSEIVKGKSWKYTKYQ